jgi:hypothetical protein
MRYTLDDIKNIIKTKTGHEFIGTVYFLIGSYYLYTLDFS